MPDKDNLGAVLTAGYRWQNDEIGLVDDGTISGLRASAGTSGFHEMNHPVVVQEAVAFQSCVDRSNPSVSVSDAAFCLPANAMSDRGQAVAFAQNQREEVREIDVPGALAAEPGTHQQTFIAQPVPFRKAKRAQSATDDESWVQAQQANTLNGFDTGERDTHAVAVSDSLVAKNNQCTGIQTEVVAHSLRAEGFDASEDGTGRGTPLVPSTPMTVRRLSCRECERLQGFPDDWTLIPWRGKPAEQCPDGPRYKALGNSMACNCMAWIGEKIQAWESAHA